MAIERKWKETDVLRNHDVTFSWVAEFYMLKSGETIVSEVRSLVTIPIRCRGQGGCSKTYR